MHRVEEQAGQLAKAPLLPSFSNETEENDAELISRLERDLAAAQTIATQLELDQVETEALLAQSKLCLSEMKIPELVSSREEDKPRREQMDILTKLAQTKSTLHEQLSGHRVLDCQRGRSVDIGILPGEDEVKLRLEFDPEQEFKLIAASLPNSFLSGSRVESELRARAVAQNDALMFVRRAKLLVFNSKRLENELADLARWGQTKGFVLEYKAATRIVSGLFKERLVAKLRVPFDYGASPVELLLVESTIVKRKDSLADKAVEQKVRLGVERMGQGNLVKHWVERLSEV